jgi:hypothetical protein
MRASLIQHGEPRRFVMSAPIPLRRDFGASHLRGLARKTKDGPQARRLLALAAIYDGAKSTRAIGIWDNFEQASIALRERHLIANRRYVDEAVATLISG